MPCVIWIIDIVENPQRGNLIQKIYIKVVSSQYILYQELCGVSPNVCSVPLALHQCLPEQNIG